MTARKLVQSKLFDVEMSLRGILRGFGLKVGPTTPSRFAGRIRELVTGQATLEVIAAALLAVHEALRREFDGFERRIRSMARADGRVRLLMSAPGVGAIVALTYVSAIDDPARFRSSKDVGAHFGLTPKKYQSGEKDVTGGITKIGDTSVRTALYEAAHIILTRPIKGGGLKSWAMKLAKRTGQGGPRPQARCRAASHVGRCQILRDGQGTQPDVCGSLRGEALPFPGGFRHQPSRRGVPSPGRWIRSGRKSLSGSHDHAQLDWPTSSFWTPSGGGHAPTPDRSVNRRQDDARKGLTHHGPLQKSEFRSSGIGIRSRCP